MARLKTNGLSVASTAQAEAFLTSVNYYRFKSYLRPYLSSATAKTFAVGSSFDDARELYEFDHALRGFVFELTGIVEMQLRHRMDQRITKFTGDPFWYLRQQAYKTFPRRTVKLLSGSLAGSKEEFAAHYLSKYHSNVGGEFNFLPPFWIASELLTVGQLVYFLKSFDKNYFQQVGSDNELDLLARDFGAFNIGHLTKWTEFVRNIRNWCAHHSRLWNRHMAKPPNLERRLSKTIAIPNDHRLYQSLAVQSRVIIFPVAAGRCFERGTCCEV